MEGSLLFLMVLPRGTLLALSVLRWRGSHKEAFMATKSSDTAPAFFGQDTRYGNRVYVGVIINAVR
jgi:hypothetical protein